MKLIKPSAVPSQEPALTVVRLSNDADPQALREQIHSVDRVELLFPKFTDGRAFSQAYLLRRRLGFHGAIRATGDVLIDQLLQMQRSGFSEAVLRADQDIEHAHQLLNQFSSFYQGDAVTTQPHFLKAA